MKPPPRTRKKPPHTPQPEPRTPTSQWQRREHRNLLRALKKHSRTNPGLTDIDYAFLRKYVPSRSISEIHAVVEYLKGKVISLASLKLWKKSLEEKKVRKPIEVWTHMASSIAGSHEEAISNAFSQMLVVSSTEPRTLRNCDPPQVYRPPTDENKPVRTVPFRPMPRFPVHAYLPVRPGIAFKVPAPTMGPARRFPAPSQVVRVSNTNIPPPQHQLSTTAGASPAATSCQPGAAEEASTTSASTQTVTPAVTKTECVGTTETPLSTTSTPNSTSTSPETALSSSATSQTPVPSAAPPPLSTTAEAYHARFGRTSKYATEDSPRMFGVKSVVDFERIYCFLSAMHKPEEKCQLTPMESAIVLDLLMSLPEELPLLHCNKLHTHLMQTYRCLSSSANPKMAAEAFKGLKDGLSAKTEAPSSPTTNSQQNTAAAAAADSSGITDSGGKNLQPGEAESQSSGSNNTSSQSEDTMRLRPPLNPFMVPLQLLRRK